MRMTRQWQALKMFKRAGRGHSPTGVAGTMPGELGLICPACPHPSINLPKDWEDCSAEDKYVPFQFRSHSFLLTQSQIYILIVHRA